MSYQFAFQQYVGLDPLSADLSELVEKAEKHQLIGAENESRDTLLQFLFSTEWSRKLGRRRRWWCIISRQVRRL